jgi:hypothetical protein
LDLQLRPQVVTIIKELMSGTCDYQDDLPEIVQSVLLKVSIAVVIITAVKQMRNRMSPEITERPAFLKRTDFNASTA